MASVESLSRPSSLPPAVAHSERGPTDRRKSPPSRWPLFLSALFVACLAFLLASFPARNSDVWLALARGRSLAHGAFSTAIGPGWLYDLCLFGSYSLVGGSGLVLLNALLVAILGLVLFRLCNPARGWWLAVVCTTLALLTMSTRLQLRPVTVSYLFLALTLWYLRPREPAVGERPGLVPPWPLLVLFVVWANMDAWFVLGLVTAALVYLGRWVDEVRSAVWESEADNQRQATVTKRWMTAVKFLGLQVIASLAVLVAVCLLNPAHFGAFASFGDLIRTGAADSSALVQGLWSPFQERYLEQFGTSPAGLAYYPLLGLGLLSFIALLPHWSAQRLLPWLGLALLSVVQVRTVMFFAVLAGPVLAWNLCRIVESKWQMTDWKYESAIRNLRSLIMALVALALLVGAWPGRLQLPPFEPRRWVLALPPSLEQAALTVQQWRKQGKLIPESRLLHVRAETANAFAWFAPEEKAEADPMLVDGVRYLKRRTEQWHQRMREKKVSYVVLYNAERGDPGQVLLDLSGLLGNPEQWPLLYQEGGVSIFGWHDPNRQGGDDPFASLTVDPDRLAFRPSEQAMAPREESSREPEPHRWWHEFWRPVPPRSVDREEATMRLFHAEALRSTVSFRHVIAWAAGELGGLVGAAGGWSGCTGGGPAALLDAHVRVVLMMPTGPGPDMPEKRVPALDRLTIQVFYGRFLSLRDQVPPSLLFLAIRAARRAVAVNPDDAQAYLILGESYLRLLETTRERVWGQKMEELVQLRRTQAITALNQAVTLQPNLAQAHGALAGLYLQLGYLDLRLKHLRIYQQLKQKKGPASPAAVEAFQQEQELLQKELERLAKSVAKREDEYLVAAAGRPVLERVKLAIRKELPGKALAMLLESHVAAFGPQGMELELELLLQTGRAKDVWKWTGPEQRALVPPERYHMLRLRALAATGNYAGAEEECTQMNQEMAAVVGGKGDVSFRHVMSLMIAQAVLDDQPAGKTWPEILARAAPKAFHVGRRVTDWAKDLKRESDVKALRGLLCLEEGDVAEAEVAFRDALDLWQSPSAAASGSAMDFNGRAMAQGYLGLLEAAWDAQPVRADKGVRQGDKETRRQGDKEKRERVLP